MVEANLPGFAEDGTARAAAGLAFGPASMGRVGPPSLNQVVLRARARLAERERMGAKLLSIGGILIAILPFWVDGLALAGVLSVPTRLATSPLMRDLLAGWSVTLVDVATVLVELLLILASLVAAGRLSAGRPKGVWLMALLGAAGSVLWLPVLWGIAIEILPSDPMSALLGSLFPAVGFAGCALMVAGGLVARMRPVRPYTK